MFKLDESILSGCFCVRPRVLEDYRGRFVKVFHRELFSVLGLNGNWFEEYYSTSKEGVLRGMHFQIPPYDHAKLVYCSFGEVMDVVVDLRKDSSTFTQVDTFSICASEANMLYIPRGLAHGFYTLSPLAVMHYMVETVYEPEYDRGILWSSIDFDWPIENPLISERDRAFISLDRFQSPF